MNYQGKKAAFQTLGCKLNFSETSAIAHTLAQAGFERVDFEEKADLYVINTCSVTNAGDKSSRNAIRRAIRRNPAAFIVVIGCYAQLSPEEISSIEGVDLVLGTREKFNIVPFLGDLRKREKPEMAVSRLQQIREYQPAFSQGDRTRSFLKIQDGCDYFCTYCTIPFARGRSRNASVEDTVAEAARAVAGGFREVVLTGVNIGDFGRSTGESFLQLLVALEKVKGLERLRMGSVEPNLLTDEVISMAAASTVIMPHFHLPLQSGSDEVLALMRRRYTTALFAGRVRKIREVIPGAFIGVDVIAGTNGETTERFRDSYDFINSLEISQLHAFPYSERSGTRALEIPGKVPVAERKLRTQQYINLSEKKLLAFYGKNCGTTAKVLLEELLPDGRITGFSENYIRTVLPSGPQRTGEIASVRLVSLLPDGNMGGEWLEKAGS